MIVCVLYCSVCLHNDKTHAVIEHYLVTAPDGLLFSSAFKSLVNVRMSANHSFIHSFIHSFPPVHLLYLIIFTKYKLIAIPFNLQSL